MKKRFSSESILNHPDQYQDLPRHNHSASCKCFIVPQSVLERLSRDKKLSNDERKSFADAALASTEIRKMRIAKGKMSNLLGSILPTSSTLASVAALGPPAVLVFDCGNGTSLPGTPVPNPGTSADATTNRTFVETTAVATFYKTLFGRNSIDDANMTMMSSVHYSVKYNNAFWDGTQMTYGDGDGNIFIDFTKSTDVIAHELTHGVTQFTAKLGYTNEAGGLNESISDVFGSMFRQWRANQTVSAADWLIGKEIMGPGAIARGFTCLRDMSKPNASHCMAPQPTKFSQYQTGMDPHESSGIPSFAFYKAAIAIGGKSWEKAGKIWYQALTGFPPNKTLKMSQFASRTRSSAKSLFPSEPAVFMAVDKAWKAVGIP